MKKKIYKIVLITLLIIEIPIMCLTFKTFNNKEINKVSYKENIKNKSTLAYYIDGELQEGMTSWPTDKEYEKAECYYGNHVEVPAEEVLEFDNASHTATITSNKTIYCSLYFGKTPGTSGGSTGNAASIIDKNSSGGTLETANDLAERNKTITGNVKDDLRRFIGTKDEVIDNFICFGTDNEDTCEDNMDLYMYRIMGIDINGRLKIIKATALVNGSTSTFAWHNTCSNITWPNSDLYKRLNGTSTNTSKYPNIFIGNSKYSYMQEEKWTKWISPTTYYIGDSPSSSNPTSFQEERSKNFENGMISLMYVSDYLYANNGQMSTDNWLSIANGLNGRENTGPGVSGTIKNQEWTMSRYQYTSCTYPWSIINTGSQLYTWYDCGMSWIVRPVFYLDSEIKIEGKGTIHSPYLLT